MSLWMDLLFGNWIGRLSVFTILFMLAMGVYFIVLFVSKSRQD